METPLLVDPGSASSRISIQMQAIASTRLFINEMLVRPRHSGVCQRCAGKHAQPWQQRSAGAIVLDPFARSALDPAGLGGVRLGSSVQICATGPSDARQPQRPRSAQHLIHPSHARATGTDLAAALSQTHGHWPNRETSFNIPLT